MKRWAIHTLFMSIILGFCQKIHTFSLPTSIGGFWGPVLRIQKQCNCRNTVLICACGRTAYHNWRVCLCEHKVSENQIQETGSGMFPRLLVFMENRHWDFPRKQCPWCKFLGRINSPYRKNQKGSLEAILSAQRYTP
jgi:hypothetical protein